MAALTTRARTILIAAGAAVVVIVVAIVIAVSVGADPAIAPGPSGSPGASPSPTASPTAGAPGDGTAPADPAAPDPLVGEPVADSVARDATADFGDGVTAVIDGVTPFTAEGSGVGEISGPAVRVAMSITNGSAAAIPLDAVTVNAFSGAGQTPAAPVSSDAAAVPFSGSLAPGATMTGAYSFSVAADDADSLVVSVSRGAGTPLVVFGR
jgi:hypothetical protein